MKSNDITAAEFLVIQTSNLSPVQLGDGKNLYATSARIPQSTNASIEALAELSGESRNSVICLLLQAGLESYVKEINGTDIHQTFLQMRDEALAKNQNTGA